MKMNFSLLSVNTNNIIYSNKLIKFLLYPMRSMGKVLKWVSTSKGPQVKTTVSIKVTNCSIPLGWILARDGFVKNCMGSRPEAKKYDFFI